MATDDDQGSLDHVLARIRDRVASKRAAGEYPPGLEDELDRFRVQLLSGRTSDGALGPLTDLIENVRSATDFGRHRITTDSALPGGTKLHRLIAKIVGRQIDGLAAQSHEFGLAVVSALVGVRESMNQLVAGGADPAVAMQLPALQERIARLERTTGIDVPIPDDLEARLVALEQHPVLASLHSPITNDAFEAAFRGESTAMRAHYGSLADRLVGFDPVLDIGCGRGEFLELLGERNVEARGVELDGRLADAARRDGLDVVAGDGLVDLTNRPTESLGGVVAIQVIEHLTAQQLVALAAESHRVLRPGGKLVVETPNCQSVFTHARGFWLDPTHVRFVHPAYLELLLKSVGFTHVEVSYASPPPDDDMMVLTGEDDQLDENFRRLNALLFAAQDVQVVATR